MPGFNIIIPPSRDACRAPGFNTGPPNITETARQHRYRLEVLEPLGSQGAGLLLYLAKCTRPSVEFDEIAIHSAQDEIFRPGKIHWKAIEFTFYEKLTGALTDLNDQCAFLLYQWWADTMLNIQTSLFNPPDTYLKDAHLNMLDGNGDPVWSYLIYDCWPAKISPADLDYSNTALSTITVMLRLSKAVEIGTQSAASATR